MPDVPQKLKLADKDSTSSTDTTDNAQWFDDSDRKAHDIYVRLEAYLKQHKVQCLRLADSSLCLLYKDKRIVINTETNNVELNDLFTDAGIPPTRSKHGPWIVQRLMVWAYRKAGDARLIKFCHRHKDTIYLPIAGNKILCIGPQLISHETNGWEHLWLEHPYEHQELKYDSKVDVKKALAKLERLCVETQACVHPEMKWFLTMGELLFPMVKEYCVNRFIMVRSGPSQQGKTSGLQRFTKLLGLGDVKGDWTVPAMNNVGDTGLLALDNKEHANLDQKFIDFLLHAATGSQRGRTGAGGHVRESGPRPVISITTIEGMIKQELINRCVVVKFKTKGELLDRLEIEDEILESRHEILSALVFVVQEFLKVKAEHLPTPNPIPEFREHFVAMCNLLRAYGRISKRPIEWAEGLIARWNEIICDREPQVHAWEYAIIEILEEYAEKYNKLVESEVYEIDGKKGIAYFIQTAGLWNLLRKPLANTGFVQGPAAFGERMRGDKFTVITPIFWNDKNHDKIFDKRKRKKPLGIFIEA